MQVFNGGLIKAGVIDCGVMAAYSPQVAAFIAVLLGFKSLPSRSGVLS